MTIAEEFYKNLIEDPDLEIGEHQTREEAAQIEADYRMRQHLNNVRALSLANEPLKAETNINKLLKNRLIFGLEKYVYFINLLRNR